METVKLTDGQKTALSRVVAGGKSDIKNVDSRSVKALEKRGLVKVTTNRKGTFVAATAKGKKLN